MGWALEASQPLSSFSSSGHFPGSHGGSFGGGLGLPLEDDEEDGELLLEELEDELLELDELEDELLELDGLDELELLGSLLEELDHWLDEDSEDCEELELDGLEEDDEEDILAYFPNEFENATNEGGGVNAKFKIMPQKYFFLMKKIKMTKTMIEQAWIGVLSRSNTRARRFEDEAKKMKCLSAVGRQGGPCVRTSHPRVSTNLRRKPLAYSRNLRHKRRVCFQFKSGSIRSF